MIEYRVRPVTRYVVTRFESEKVPPGVGTTAGVSRTLGEYENDDTAYQVGYALCRAEHEQLGYPLGDMRIIYPSRPGDAEYVRGNQNTIANVA